ncbi:hypothetical protein ACA910_017750 [Epithemia clementina (nom. ined.)]
MSSPPPEAKPSAATENVSNTKRSEADVYDRQIRLWGADAQAKMSQAKVLYIHMTGVTSEILKNLVLAGIRPAICDVRKVADCKEFLRQTPSFFWATAGNDGGSVVQGGNEDNGQSNKRPKFSATTIGELVQPAIEDLNPLLGTCELVNSTVSDLVTTNVGEELLRSFTVVVASRVTPKEALTLASKLSPDQKFFLVDSFGWHGSCWVDLGPKHVHRPEKGKELLDATTLSPYIPVADMFTIPLHSAVNRFHKVTPPPSLVYHRVLLAFFEHKEQWPSTAIDSVGFVKYIREIWLPETSPSLLDNDLFTEAALQNLAQQGLCEMIAICSVTGGMVGNEIIKAISGKGEPANNTVLFDGTTCKGWFFLLQANNKLK